MLDLETSYETVKSHLKHGPATVAAAKPFLESFVERLDLRSGGRGLRRFLGDFFPHPEDQKLFVSTHTSYILRNCRDPGLFRNFVRENLFPVSIDLANEFLRGVLSTSFLRTADDDLFARTFSSLRILLELMGRGQPRMSTASATAVASFIARLQYQQQLLDTPDKCAMVTALFKLVLFYRPVLRGAAGSPVVGFRGIGEEAWSVAAWKGWLDRHSFGGLPCEVAKEILFMSWL
jgi:hypothetical protein